MCVCVCMVCDVCDVCGQCVYVSMCTCVCVECVCVHVCMCMCVCVCGVHVCEFIDYSATHVVPCVQVWFVVMAVLLVVISVPVTDHTQRIHCTII